MKNKQKRTRKQVLVMVAAYLVFFCLSFGICTSCSKKNGSVKYVFLFIGDGMGLAHIHAAELYKGTREGDAIKIQKLNFTEFPGLGLMTTYSSNSFITDSGAAATAMATGRKTNNGRVSVDEKSVTEYKTIAEGAKERGMKVGVLTNTPLDHVTPASFYSHEPYRWYTYEIAVDMIHSGFDFFGGGGITTPTGMLGQERDFAEIARENGYTIVNTKEDFLTLKPGMEKVITINEKLTPKAAMPYEIDRAADDVSLAQYVRKAIDLLDNEKGFFIMAEGGKIDWAAHDNDTFTVIKEILALELAIQEALEFYRRHPQETLIVVTADHETGGMSLGSEFAGYRMSPELLNSQNISLKQFIEQLLKPYRSLAERENWQISDLLPLIEKHLGIAYLTEEKKEALWEEVEKGNEEAWWKLKMSFTKLDVMKLQEALSNINDNLFYFTLIRIFNEKAGFSWTTDAHTAIPVPVFAIGVNHQKFSGYYDNVDIAKKLAEIMNIPLD